MEPDHLLLLNDGISPVKKERLCGDGSVCDYFAYFKSMLEQIADSGGDPLILIVLMHIQSVQIACSVNIAKAYDEAVFYGNKRIMLR